MRLLLLNNNPAVSRLIRLSVEKVGYHLDEYNDYALVPLQKYDLILVDNEMYHENEFKSMCEQSECGYSIYIGQRGHTKPESTNVLLEKPFLPTDFLGLLEKVKNVLSSFKVEPKNEMIDLNTESPFEEEKTQAFDIDSLESLPSSLESLGFEEDDYAVARESEKSLSLDDLPEELNLFEEPTNEVVFASSELEKDEVTLPTFELEMETEEDVLETSLSHPIEELNLEEEINGSILDKDDINEVKLLLDESEEESLSFDEDLKLDVELPIEDEPLLDFEESIASVKEEEPFTLALEEEEVLENEIPLAFDEIESLESESAIEDEPAVFSETGAAFIVPMVDVVVEETEDEIPQIKEMVFDSIDALNENAIKRAFGEYVEEELVVPLKATSEEIDTLKNEVEQAITQSLSQLTQSESLREALKGMRINVSITFEEV